MSWWLDHFPGTRVNNACFCSTPAKSIDESCCDSRTVFMKNHIYVKAFLRKHGFKDAVTAKSGLEESPQRLIWCFRAIMKLALVLAGGCIFKRESLYPIHVAVMQGDVQLATGSEPKKQS